MFGVQGASLSKAASVFVAVSSCVLCNANPVLAQDDSALSQHLAARNAEIRLHRGALRLDTGYPANLTSEIKTRSLAATATVPVASIMQLDAPLTPETRAKLAADGITIEEYLGGTTYLVGFSPIPSLSTRGLLGVSQSGSPLNFADKVKAAARQPLALPDNLSAEAEKPPVSLTVEFLKSTPDKEARQMLAQMNIDILRKAGERTYVVAAGPDKADLIAKLEAVKVVDGPPTPFLPLNDTARRVSGGDQVQLFTHNGSAGAPVYSGLAGRGIRIGIADSGIDEKHEDFNQVNQDGAVGTSRVYNVRTGSGGHGTHVGSIAAGSGLNSGANGLPAFSMRGQAPAAEVGDYAQLSSRVASYHAAIVDDGSDVTNHSYVQSRQSSYDSEAATIDSIIRGDSTHNGTTIPPRPQVWAAGNNGTFAQYGDEEGFYATFTSAKNPISVGSVDSRDLRVSNFSSLGPTFDGRIKPDLVAPGCNDSIASPAQPAPPKIEAANHGTQGYTGKCGTSMAAPVVSGIIALMMEAFERATGNEQNLRPATYKALLIHTARDLHKMESYRDREFNNPDTGKPIVFQAGPDYSTGYGLVDAPAAVNLIVDQRRWAERSHDRTGDRHRLCVDVPAGAQDIKVAIAWDDEPGSTLTSITTSKLVNDLDLKLVGPDGSEVLPWVLDPLPLTASPGSGGKDPISTADLKPARRGVDHLNNVEVAHMPLPTPGRWIVQVDAFNLPTGQVQPYSVVASQPLGACADN